MTELQGERVIECLEALWSLAEAQLWIAVIACGWALFGAFRRPSGGLGYHFGRKAGR